MQSVKFQQIRLPCVKGAVARKLEEWQFTFKERLRDCYGTNYFLYQIYSIDIIIGFTVLPKFYLSITTY